MSKKFLICFNPNVNNSSDVKSILEKKLLNNNINPDITTIDELKSGYDFAFVIGGDGTILKSARYYSKCGTSLFGINLGRLGFLSQASVDEIDNAIEQILNNQYKIEKRIMLNFEDKIALNDFVVKGNESSRASKFALEINNKFVCEYYADGIIVSTPTGSTAYNMASGGPIIAPNTDAIVIVPICPHTFSARPIVVSSSDEIKILKNSQYLISADGQEVFGTDKDILITKSKYCANLVLLNNNDFYSVLRNKLHWGLSPNYKK